jgi:two-component system OmpR family sensor kinase
VRADKDNALLVVEDDGPGVAEASLPHLFKRFYRADEAHSRDVEGAGLVLSIVHSICTAHGGSISVSNRVPTGCLVAVQLPRTA